MARTQDHGLTQYRYGCRCGVCRAANSRAVREWRERKRLAVARPPREPEQLPPLVDVPATDDSLPTGDIELALQHDLAALVGEPPWKGTLSAMLLTNARVLDQVSSHERYDIMSGLMSRTLEMLDRLRKVDSRGAGELEGILRDLGTPG